MKIWVVGLPLVGDQTAASHGLQAEHLPWPKPEQTLMWFVKTRTVELRYLHLFINLL
jgi:hypothetical protein